MNRIISAILIFAFSLTAHPQVSGPFYGPVVAGTPASGPPSPLNLATNYWKCGEASGNRADSAGSVTLVQQGTVAAVARGGSGIQATGNACNFASSASNYFTFSSTTVTGTTGGPWSMSAWYNCLSYTGGRAYPLAHTTFFSDSGIFISPAASSTTSIDMFDELGNGARWDGEVSLTCPGWNFMAIAVNGTTHATELWVNGTDYGSGGNLPGAFIVTKLGVEGDLGAGTNGYFDEMGFWSNYQLNSTDAGHLWNSGAGLAY